MKRLSVSLLAAWLLLVSSAVSVLAHTDIFDPARDAIEERYEDVQQAVADGYVQETPCIEVPGLGGMGFHYVNFGLIDPVVDELTPEVVLYAPDDDELELVAVEYIALALANTTDGPAPWFDPTPPPGGWFTTEPTVFGQTMNPPMQIEPGVPWFYTLHVWLFEENPAGIFAGFNPEVSCAGDDQNDDDGDDD